MRTGLRANRNGRSRDVRRFGCDGNAGLAPAERAVALALRRLVEEDLYWVMVYDRWVVDANWRVFRDVVLGGIPPAVRPAVAAFARRGVRRQLVGHGLGLHARDEVHAIGRRDVGALAEFLGDKPFLMGAAPTEIDATAYGLLANVVLVPLASPVREAARERDNLVAWLERMRARYFA